MPDIRIDSVVQRNPKLISNQMDGEIVMMSIDNGEYYGLDEIGSRIWELMESPVVVGSIIKDLMAEFDVSYDECAKDTIEFLEDLLNKDLLMIGS